MKISEVLDAATMGDRKKSRQIIYWTMLEYLFRGMPHGFSLLVIWELFKPLQNPGVSLNYSILISAVGGILISIILLNVVSKIAYNKMFDEAYEFSYQGRLQMADHLRRLSMGFYNAKDPGEIGSYLINDYANLEFILTHFIAQIYGSISMPVLLLIFLGTMNWQLALIALFVIPLALPFVKGGIWLVTKFGKPQKQAIINAQSRILEYVYGMRYIKAFNLVGSNFKKLKFSFDTLKKLSIKLEAGIGPVVIFSGLILSGGFTLIILFGATFLFANAIPLPVYIAFLILGSEVFNPIIQGLIYYTEMSYYNLGVARIQNLLATPILSGTNPDLKMDGFKIELENVTFKYHNTEVLQNVSITFPEKSLTALVGPSGSGKTTITRLIARFWDANEGKIKIGNHDIREYNPDYLISHISMVFQDVYLFNDTILNNIRIGNRDATMEQIKHVAKLARIDTFIENLPDKYDTMVGEAGVTLSGGEKQRISIARAMLKDSPIILLDEATASLDPENELYIQQALNELIKNKTVIVIAHRLNTVVSANNIIVLDNGKIKEIGPHQELLKQNGLYHSMWAEQLSSRNWKFAKK